MSLNRTPTLFDSLETEILTVSDITTRIKGLLEGGLRDVWVEGEVSNFKCHGSGHCYFTLKDRHAQIRCVIWRSTAMYLRFKPSDGMLVRIRGGISVYEARGDYQLIVRSIRPAGEGALRKAFEMLKAKLEAEGLFDLAHKRQLPRFPEQIGIVTSSEGAALHDILSILARRFPAVEVLVCAVPVQGADAAGAIASAIRTLDYHAGPNGNPHYRVDVMIVGRGGGSAEDLWAFNEEIVARAIHASRIPIISAVGHEVDFSISDFVADARAATPSMAAELAVPDGRDVAAFIQRKEVEMRGCALELIAERRRRILEIIGSHAFNRPVDRMHEYAQRIDDLGQRMHRAVCRCIEQNHSRIEMLQHRIEAFNPNRPLQQGYAWVEKNGKHIKDAASLESDDEVTMRFHDGSRRAVVR